MIGYANRYNCDISLNWNYSNAFPWFNKYKTNTVTGGNLYREPGYHYVPIPYDKNGVKLWGFFQSEKYFEDCKSLVKLTLILDKTLKQQVNNEYKSYLGNNKRLAFIQVRRGDYLKQQERHPVLSLDYYKNAMNKFSDDTTFLVLSDDIDWCKKEFPINFPNKDFIFHNNISPIIDLFIASKCYGGILANSSFSWWSAWLGKKKKVIAPSTWVGPALSRLNTKDLYLKDWIII
jgi:hypothetical protein